MGMSVLSDIYAPAWGLQAQDLKNYRDCGIQYCYIEQHKFDIYHCWFEGTSVNHASLVIIFAK